MITCMLVVIPDTNALFGTQWTAAGAGPTLTALAAEGLCLIVLPEVVVDELQRHHPEAFISARKAAHAALRTTPSAIDMHSIDREFDEVRSSTPSRMTTKPPRAP